MAPSKKRGAEALPVHQAKTQRREPPPSPRPAPEPAPWTPGTPAEAPCVNDGGGGPSGGASGSGALSSSGAAKQKIPFTVRALQSSGGAEEEDEPILGLKEGALYAVRSAKMLDRSDAYWGYQYGKAGELIGKYGFVLKHLVERV